MASKNPILEQQRCLSVLELHSNCTDDEIRKAYKKLALQYHPDKNSSEDAKGKFQEIGYAYKYLTEGPSELGNQQQDVGADILIRLFEEMFCPRFTFGFGAHPFFYDNSESDDNYFTFGNDNYDSDDDEYIYGQNENSRTQYNKNTGRGQNTFPAPQRPAQTVHQPSKKQLKKQEKRERQRAQAQEKKQQTARPNSAPYSTPSYSDDIVENGASTNKKSKDKPSPAKVDKPAEKTEIKKTPAPSQQTPQQKAKKSKKQLKAEEKKRKQEMQQIAAEIRVKQEKEAQKQKQKSQATKGESKPAAKEEENGEENEFLAWYESSMRSGKTRKKAKKTETNDHKEEEEEGEVAESPEFKGSHSTLPSTDNSPVNSPTHNATEQEVGPHQFKQKSHGYGGFERQTGFATPHQQYQRFPGPRPNQQFHPRPQQQHPFPARPRFPYQHWQQPFREDNPFQGGNHKNQNQRPGFHNHGYHDYHDYNHPRFRFNHPRHGYYDYHHQGYQPNHQMYENYRYGEPHFAPRGGSSYRPRMEGYPPHDAYVSFHPRGGRGGFPRGNMHGYKKGQNKTSKATKPVNIENGQAREIVKDPEFNEECPAEGDTHETEGKFFFQEKREFSWADQKFEELDSSQTKEHVFGAGGASSGNHESWTQGKVFIDSSDWSKGIGDSGLGDHSLDDNQASSSAGPDNILYHSSDSIDSLDDIHIPDLADDDRHSQVNASPKKSVMASYYHTVDLDLPEGQRSSKPDLDTGMTFGGLLKNEYLTMPKSMLSDDVKNFYAKK